MLRISKLTDYAIIVLGYMAREPARIYAATDLSDAVGVAVPTVSKILKALARAEVLKSIRGAKGGYRLLSSPENISVAAVINALEGPIALTECGLEHDPCRQSAHCQTRSNWAVINRAIQTALESVTLSDMAVPMAKPPEEIRIPVSHLYPLPK